MKLLSSIFQSPINEKRVPIIGKWINDRCSNIQKIILKLINVQAKKREKIWFAQFSMILSNWEKFLFIYFDCAKYIMDNWAPKLYIVL